MAKKTDIYGFYTLEPGDIVYPGFDKNNMQIIEGQLSDLIGFVGSGTIDGWEVISLKRPLNTNSSFGIVMNFRRMIANAQRTSNLHQQYLLMGSPNINENNEYPSAENIWSLVFCVSPGEGIVGLYHAKTLEYAFLLLPSSTDSATRNYDVWMQPSLCLVTDGLSNVIFADSSDYEAYQNNTYLASITIVNNEITQIEYTDNRKNLNNLASALRYALNKYFYRHIHAGLPDHPSEITLNTEKIINFYISLEFISSTYFAAKNEDGSDFTWDSRDYGSPRILLDNQELPIHEYSLEPSLGRIYLKNNLSLGSLLQMILPLASEIKLIPINEITTGQDILLTDSSITTKEVFQGDPGNYESPKVYINGELIENSGNTTYEMPNLSKISFMNLIDTGIASKDDLYIIVTSVQKEIQNKLSGNRIKDIDASSFTRGTIEKNRFAPLDHVGLIRYKEIANLMPYLRLFDSGNHNIFYPEKLDNPIQYNTEINVIYKSIVFGQILIGSKRGLFQTTDFQTISPVSSWIPDMGLPIYITDNIILGTGENYFNTTYILTSEGKIYYTEDTGATWQSLKLPKITLAGNKVYTPKITSFIVSTNKIQGDKNIAWQIAYYAGTESNGLFKAVVGENQKSNEWAWSRLNFETYNSYVTVYALAEVCTTNYTLYSDGTSIENTVRTIYAGTDEGFYLSTGGLCRKIAVGDWNFQKTNLDSSKCIKEIHCILSGYGKNNIIWRDDKRIFITHTAQEIISSGDDFTSITWKHPFGGFIPSDSEISNEQIIAVDVTTNNSDIEIISSLLTDTLITTRVEGVGNRDYINGIRLIPNISKILFTHFIDPYAVYNGVYYYISSDDTTSTFTRTNDLNDLSNPLYFKGGDTSNHNLFYLSASGVVINNDDLLFEEIWSNPLTILNPISVDIAIDFSSIVYSSFDSDFNLLEVDGVEIISGTAYINDIGLVSLETKILFNHFMGDQSIYNGIYVYKEVVGDKTYFVRSDDMYTSFDLLRTFYVNVADEFWRFFGLSEPQINESQIVFEKLNDNFNLISNYSFSKICEVPQFYEYWILSNNDIYSIKNDKYNVLSKKWKMDLEFTPRDIGIISTHLMQEGGGSIIKYGDTVVGSDRGLWILKGNTDWQRIDKEITIGTGKLLPTIYKFSTGEKIDQLNNWFFDEKSQSIIFYEYQPIGTDYIYEKDYIDYYVSPWDTNSDVILYENDLPANIPYKLTPNEGKITFSTSRDLTSIIKITIIKQNAFIDNVGVSPHEELSDIVLVQEPEIAVLSETLLVDSEYIEVADKSLLNSSIQYLELRFGEDQNQIRERINVYIDDLKRIKIVGRRSTDFIFPKTDTKVFKIVLTSVIGIEDKISLANSNQMYHFNSLSGLNLLQLMLFAKNNVVGLPNYFKNTLLLNSSDWNTAISSTSSYIGFEPQTGDIPTIPHSIYFIYKPSVDGVDVKVFTDKGIWFYQDNMWQQESDLDGASNIYFVRDTGDYISIGTNGGLWSNSTGEWILNPLYPQVIYDYLTFSSGNMIGWLYGKNNGAAFVLQSDTTIPTFKSTAFNLVDGMNVYGLYKGYYLKIDEQTSEQKKTEILYLCTEIGLFGVTIGVPMAGREMFGDSPLRHIPIGSSQSVPVKIYKIFQNVANTQNIQVASDAASTPLIILTNNGVYIIRNWRWCTLDADALDFWPESHPSELEGKSCYCYINIQRTKMTPNNIEIQFYQIFIGTDTGVYRSNDNGYTWDKCEKINGNDIVVYDLKFYLSGDKDILIAATEEGFYTSIDYGDTWEQTGASNPNAIFNGYVTSGVPFNSSDVLEEGYLSQSFMTPNISPFNVTKLSIYLGKDK